MGKKGKSRYQGKFKVGDKFGRYTVIEDTVVLKHQAEILCKCECGRTNLVSCYTLTKGTSTQCIICGNSLKKENNPAWKGYGNIHGKTISKLKRDAILRNIDFNITIEFLDELYLKQNKCCALTGIQLSMESVNQTASLDRINSNVGYIENNVQWVHKDVNMMKKDYDQDYFITICKLIANYKSLI